MILFHIPILPRFPTTNQNQTPLLRVCPLGDFRRPLGCLDFFTGHLGTLMRDELWLIFLSLIIARHYLSFTTHNTFPCRISQFSHPSPLDTSTTTRDQPNNLQNSLPTLTRRPTLGRLHGTKRNRSRRNQRACSYDQRPACRTQPRGTRRLWRRRPMVLPHPF
jgi:hypothetical protein